MFDNNLNRKAAILKKMATILNAKVQIVLFINSVQFASLTSNLVLASQNERFFSYMGVSSCTNMLKVIPLFHTGPESHELTNIWIRG